MDSDVVSNGGFQLTGAPVYTAPNLFFGQQSEPAQILVIDRAEKPSEN
jgi:hypothetical protein